MKKITLLLILMQALFVSAKVDKQAYYDALASDDLAVVNAMITSLEKESQTTTIKAYKGAMLAKKANFIVKASEKLSIFKSGVDLLEKAISAKPENAEYRFLRLSIQEHAPKILKYQKEIEEDKNFIIAHFSKVESDLKAIIKDYTKESEVLKMSDLK